MKKIISKWMAISMGCGMIPVVILGASPGGIALIPFILLFSMFVGLIGAAIHVNVLCIKAGTIKQRVLAGLFFVLSTVMLWFVVYSEISCELKPQFAQERVANYIRSKPELDVNNLGMPVINLDKCVCTFEYSSPDERFTVIVTEYGKLHFSRKTKM